jgi:putative acetyltransferase
MAFTDLPTYDIRYTESDDLTALLSWLERPEVLYWFTQTTREEVDQLVRNWIGFSRYRASITAIYEGQPIGIATLFLMPYRKVSHMAMPFFVVDPQFQRKGVGGSLIKNLKNHAKMAFGLERLFTEIFEGCPAISLLKKFDFRTVAVQPDFAKIEGKYLARHTLEVTL